MTETDGPHPHVGVRDVARYAGVSAQTVSRVLNDRPGIRDETRSRVLDAMAALDYRMNNAARALGTSTSRTLGVIASDATLYGPAAGIAALEAAARAAGRWVSTTYADAADDASVVTAAQHLLAQGVDAILLVAPHARTRDALAGMGLTLAALHDGEGAAAQSDGIRLVVEHLVELGHRRIAHLAGPPDWVETAARVAGFDRALHAAHLERVPGWSGDWSAASGERIAREVAAAVRTAGGPSAVVVANDQMALGLVAGLRAAGVDVPGEVSITGFDDNPDSAYYRPALTTVRLDIAGEARRCVAEVLAAAASTPQPPELCARDSTAPFRP